MDIDIEKPYDDINKLIEYLEGIEEKSISLELEQAGIVKEIQSTISEMKDIFSRLGA